uniref:Activator of Hsp90 ATPase AHSA1-like N-terminal domain-containing protein n=1 Tax=Glycine max TaxID=3847 RepID=I1J497_SOYBN
MESGALVSSEKEGQQGASYTYWVRKITEDAAPLPVPRKLNPEDVPPCHSQSQSRSATLGSAWNRAGTWEEKSLNNWATPRIKELLISLGSIQFSFGRAEVEDVTKCVGDAFMVIVRNKKRVGYTYELSLKVKGEGCRGMDHTRREEVRWGSYRCPRILIW